MEIEPTWTGLKEFKSNNLKRVKREDSMVKQSVVGYVTALVNTHCGQLNNIPPANTQAINSQQCFIDELNGLLDFIEDIQEEETVVINICNGMGGK